MDIYEGNWHACSIDFVETPANTRDEWAGDTCPGTPAEAYALGLRPGTNACYSWGVKIGQTNNANDYGLSGGIDNIQITYNEEDPAIVFDLQSTEEQE
jgi:hypothetical protein